MSKPSRLNISCLVVFLLLLNGNALAHRVAVFAWVEGDTVLGEGKFSGGKKAQNAEIIVRDLNGKELLRTRTNTKGEFSFPVPAKTAMCVELAAGEGHKADWTIPLEDIDETAAAQSVRDTVSPPAGPAENTDSGQAVHPALPTDPARLEAIVERAVTKALDKKITPLTRMVADLRQTGPAMNEIIGGIGYIFGLMGVAIYFSSRKKKS